MVAVTPLRSPPERRRPPAPRREQQQPACAHPCCASWNEDLTRRLPAFCPLRVYASSCRLDPTAGDRALSDLHRRQAPFSRASLRSSSPRLSRVRLRRGSSGFDGGVRRRTGALLVGIRGPRVLRLPWSCQLDEGAPFD